MISAKVGGKTCFFVSSPWSTSRQNLTVQSSCGASAPSTWSAPTVVDRAASSYSSLVYTPSGKLLDLFSAPPTTHAALPLPLTSPSFGGSQCVAEARISERRTVRGSASRRCRSLGWREEGTPAENALPHRAQQRPSRSFWHLIGPMHLLSPPAHNMSRAHTSTIARPTWAASGAC